MKPGLFLLLLFFLIADGCSDEGAIRDPGDVTGKLIRTSGCGGFKTARTDVEISDTLSCVSYTYDKVTGKLSILHQNTGFNCCPDTLKCNIYTNRDTIIVEESEKTVGCKCNCLFDMDMELTGVAAGKYWIRMVEPYAGDTPKILFSVDLKNKTTGSFCVTRKKYPWGF
jgi:hypothetical protein